MSIPIPKLFAQRTRERARPIWDEEPSLPAKLLRGVFLALYAGAVLVPIWAVLATSLASEEALTRAGGDLVLFPTDFSLQAYRLTVGAAYGLSRPGTLWHTKLLMAILVTLLFAPGMYPSYLVVQNLGLLNNMWALILPVCFSAWNLIVLRTFFMNSVPPELIDAAKIDGAGEFKILFRIVLPMSKAILAVIGLFYAVGFWNTYFLGVLYTPGMDVKPIQVLIQQWLLASSGPTGQDAAAAAAISSGMENAPAASLKMAAVVCTIIPIVIMYPFIQKHFTKAVITGAVKG
jgi:putative aldouronate transport system permease protein